MDTQEASQSTKQLHVKDFPDDLFWRLKARALERRMTLRDYLVMALKAHERNDDSFFSKT